MTESATVEWSAVDLPGVSVSAYRETPFFSTLDGQLCQWIEIDLACTEGWRNKVVVEIRSGGRVARRTVVLKQGEYTLRAYAPAIWPAPPDPSAELRVLGTHGEGVGTIAIGSHPPWTCYLLSDCCADDSWAYGDLVAHDRDDYRTTLAELAAGEGNRYNYPSVYQIARFCRQATSEEKAALRDALQCGRFYLSPVPNQLLCGAFALSAYPLLLEPYRYWRAELGVDAEQVAAYHMEAPTWTNGLVNLFACAGFRLFGKSLLRYLAPWLDRLEALPLLTRLEVAPGRSVLLVLHPNGYSEGFPLLAGTPEAERWLHDERLPRAADRPRVTGAGPPPVSALPIVGMYSDLCPEMPEYVAAKTAAVSEYAAQAWEYPRLVNGTWEEYTAHVERELQAAACAAAAAEPAAGADRLRAVRGDTGSSWETWMSAAQVEWARFRRAQRDVVALRTLRVMLPPTGSDVSLGATLQSAVLELVELGDHAWNGSSEASKALNLSIRRDRLARIEAGVSAVRNVLFRAHSHGGAPQVGVVNTLGWTRTCRANLPWEWGFAPSCLADARTGEMFPVMREGRATWAYVPEVPGFGCRTLELRRGLETVHAQVGLDRWPLQADRMRPLLIVGERELAAEGGWRADGRGRWRVGAFTVEAVGRPSPLGEGLELVLSVEGAPPEEPYELRWLFDLPWTEATWRGESGGGFVTPGPVEQGGDSLLGITGSIFSCGEGLSAISPGGDRALDFAFDQTGLCGLGGRSTRAAQGAYGERLPPDVVRLSTWDSTHTPARLEWYLLATAQNHREALIDQGGARRWSFRCVLRSRRTSAGDPLTRDATLYRFACGANTSAELVDPDAWPYDGPWLAVEGGEGVLVLGAHRGADGATCVDLYNTSREQISAVLRGPVVEGRTVQLADPLGRVQAVCTDGQVCVEPLAFARVKLQA